MSQLDWLRWVKQLQAIAQTGLHFCKNDYDRERYEQVMALAIEISAAYTDDDPATIQALFHQDGGYATPKIDVRGVVLRDERVLLVQEASDGLWTLPGGWADVGDTPSQAVMREIREEAGFETQATRLLAVYDRDTEGHPALPFAVYKMFFLCEITGGTATTSHETLAVDFFARDQLPPLSTSRVLPAQIDRFFEMVQTGRTETDFN